MKKYILLLIVMCCAVSTQAQVTEEDHQLLDELMGQEADMMLALTEVIESYETEVDVQASHPEGHQGLEKHLEIHGATLGAQEGAVVVGEQSVEEKYDEKAMSAITGITKWNPATKNGQPVISKLSLSISF